MPAEATPGSPFSQGREHVAGSSRSWLEEGEVSGAVAFIDIHSIVCESLVELRTWRGVWHGGAVGVAWTSCRGVWSSLLREGEVVEVEAVEAEVVWRHAFIKGASVELQTRRRHGTAGWTTVVAHGWSHRKGRVHGEAVAHAIEVKVHIEVTGEVWRRMRERRRAIVAWSSSWWRHRLA